MAIDTDDEILQDFLVEASEILELLGEQLIDLEHSPDDDDLLNAIFRGFHTVKGGAGFLAIDNLVIICHKAEDLFNLLRQGDLEINPRIMDAILQSLDVVNDMMESTQGGIDPEPAPAELLAELSAIISGESGEPAAPVAVSEPEPVAEVPPPAEEEKRDAAGEDITDDEFDALLDQLHGKGQHGDVAAVAPPPPAPESGDITDDDTTVENAADLEDLRVALGAERLHFVAISYGTHLALAYIRRYPDRVGRAVLAGVEGLDHTWKRPAIVDGIVRQVGATLEVEAGWSGFVEDIEAALARLRDEKPVVTVDDPASGGPVNVALGPQDLKLAVFYGLGEREDFVKAAKRVRRIARGDNELLARYVLMLRTGGTPPVMPLSMDCASGVSAERLALIESEKTEALVGDVCNLSLEVVCPSWPVEDLGSEFRSDQTSDVPVLAISGTLDSRTPPSNAEEALAGFSEMHHLLIVGGGHDDDLLISDDAIGEAMVRFLESGDPGRKRVELSPL